MIIPWCCWAVRERAAHVREVLTGYRAGPQYAPNLSPTSRYKAKAVELGVGVRTLQRWVADFRQNGEAGLAPKRDRAASRPLGRVDQRWVDVALEVMVIDRTNARVVVRFGEGVVKTPSRTTAFRVLEELERRHPTFRLSAKRNRDIADRSDGVYGKPRPTRPGEYVLMDSTRLAVFALDPVTLRWINCELTVAMDWYTRCVTGIRLTPVSTKAVDAATRPAVRRPGASGPAMVPETIVVDHGKVFVSEHLTSVCARMGISIQPARLRTGRDKGRWSGSSAPCARTCCRRCPATRGRTCTRAGSTRKTTRASSSTNWKRFIREWVAVVFTDRR
ncbi:transposase [Amycolatopsis sp. NPDC051045]|uniref:transposase n=1 Tax=Amycolatopsis sp. NPDC051045 TaxID=3156922 RepID=UPI003426D5D4